jgi:YVTN family beta-propeller protein
MLKPQIKAKIRADISMLRAPGWPMIVASRQRRRQCGAFRRISDFGAIIPSIPAPTFNWTGNRAHLRNCGSPDGSQDIAESNHGTKMITENWHRTLVRRLGGTRATVVLSCLFLLYAAASQSQPLAFVSNQGDGLSVLDLATLKTLQHVDMQAAGPRGLAVTPDGKYVLTADQKTGAMSVIDAHSLKVVRSIHIGTSPEFMRVLPDGSKAFVTYEPESAITGGKPIPGKKEHEGAELPGHIAVIDLKDWKVVDDIVGAPETEGLEFTPDRKNLVIANEGNDTLSLYNFRERKVVRKVSLTKYGLRPRGIKLAPDGKRYIVTMELSGNFLVLDDKFNVLKSVKTAQGPYGVSFDPSGSRIFVAAAMGGQFQVFDAATYKPLASILVGKRCWHFSFTPDASKVLLACGRSNDVEVIDAKTYQMTTKISDFKLPWGVVTWPRSFGSLDAAQR